jgi:hypothetical protein
LSASNPPGGLECDRALTSYQEPDVGHHLAEIWRLRGGCLLALDGANNLPEGRRRASFPAIRENSGKKSKIISLTVEYIVLVQGLVENP